MTLDDYKAEAIRLKVPVELILLSEIKKFEAQAEAREQEFKADWAGVRKEFDALESKLKAQKERDDSELRDNFATEALKLIFVVATRNDGNTKFSELAEGAYGLADAMMEARGDK